MPEGLDHFRDLIPEDEHAVAGIRVLNYLDSEGRLCTTWEVEGEPSMRDALGMLEVCRFQVGAQILAGDA